ncbi:hypothetical protein COH20_001839 [Aspergillus flavus]|nr:hypothetical protein COH21_000403 [Aspergillus flavus]RAQ76271.1 hypothetical protein COH20_001839 [Aspergillus flavus]
MHRPQVKGSMKNAALEEVEQEREVAFEIEQEREIQRPLSMKAHRYPGLHSSVRNFAITGHLKGNEGYVKAAAVIKSTDLGRKHGIDASTLLCSLYVSTEFTRTVVTKKRTKTIDNFLRPVDWLLWNSQTNVGLVIILEEAEEHRSRSECSSLTVSITAHFRAFLKGGLHHHGFHYEFLLEQLRLDSEKPITNVNPAGASTAVACDNSFGQDISHTPMGYVCQGSRLRRDHPFLLARKAVEEIEDADRCLFYTTKHRYSDELGEYYDSDDDDDDDDVVAEDVDMIEGGEDDVSDVDVDMHEED